MCPRREESNNSMEQLVREVEGTVWPDPGCSKLTLFCQLHLRLIIKTNSVQFSKIASILLPSGSSRNAPYVYRPGLTPETGDPRRRRKNCASSRRHVFCVPRVNHLFVFFCAASLASAFGQGQI